MADDSTEDPLDALIREDCALCGKPLNDGGATIRDGKAYCLECALAHLDLEPGKQAYAEFLRSIPRDRPAERLPE